MKTFKLAASALGELLGIDYESMGLSQLYGTSDHLIRKRKYIEDTLFKRLQTLFNLELTITLYDLINTYFEGEVGRNTKAKRGHLKEKRSDSPLLTLGLVVDGSGFFSGRRSWCRKFLLGVTNSRQERNRSITRSSSLIRSSSKMLVLRKRWNQLLNNSPVKPLRWRIPLLSSRLIVRGKVEKWSWRHQEI